VNNHDFCPHRTKLTDLLDIETDRSIVIPEERAAEAGLRSDQVKINPRYGGGYPANVEGLHQLHCLVRVPHPSKAAEVDLGTTAEPPSSSIIL